MVGPQKYLARIWPLDAVNGLASAWIETPFQLVSVASTPSGLGTIAEMTGLPVGEVAQLVERTRALLTANEQEQLRVAVRTEEMPLGALKPKDGR